MGSASFEFSESEAFDLDLHWQFGEKRLVLTGHRRFRRHRPAGKVEMVHFKRIDLEPAA